jgi:hypothetical protein
LTLNNNGRGPCRFTHQQPLSEDIKPELDLYNSPKKYDSVMTFYSPGPVPQDLVGFGGGSMSGTSFSMNYGEDGRWKLKNGKCWGLDTCIHEWSHGLDGFFGSQGYVLEDLHHLYLYQNMGLRHEDFFSALHTGELEHGYGSRYGYSRSVWMSGTPCNRAEIPPCQLLAPGPQTIASTGALTLRWARTWAPEGYQVTFCKADTPAEPFYTCPSHQPSTVIPKGKLPPGSYVWYVQARKGTALSKVGDRFPIQIVEEAQLAPIRIERPILSNYRVRGDGDQVKLLVEINSPAGAGSIFANVVQPDGRTQAVGLQKRSVLHTDRRWQGAFWVTPNPRDTEANCSVMVTVTDHCGRSASSEKISLVVPAVKSRAEATSALSSVKFTNILFYTTQALPDVQWIRVALDGIPKANPDGHVWAELKYSSGAIDYFPFIDNSVGMGDWHTGTMPGRYARLMAQKKTSPDCTVTFAYRTPGGQITRSTPRRIVLLNPETPRTVYDSRELFKRTTSTGETPQFRERLFQTGWSQIVWTADIGNRLTTHIDVDQEGEYDIVGAFMYDADYGSLRASANGHSFATPVVLYAPARTMNAMHYIGRCKLKKGENSFSLEAVTPAPESQGRRIGLNGLILVPVDKS